MPFSVQSFSSTLKPSREGISMWKAHISKTKPWLLFKNISSMRHIQLSKNPLSCTLWSPQLMLWWVPQNIIKVQIGEELESTVRKSKLSGEWYTNWIARHLSVQSFLFLSSMVQVTLSDLLANEYPHSSLKPQMPEAPESTVAPQFSGNFWQFQEATGINAIHD